MSIRDHLCLTEHQHNFSPLGVYHQENTRLPASMCISAYSFIYSSSTFFMYCCSFSLWVWLYIHGYVHAGDTHVCSGVCIHMESRGKPQVWFFGCHPTFLFYLYSLSLAQVWWNRNTAGSLDIDPQGSSSHDGDHKFMSPPPTYVMWILEIKSRSSCLHNQHFPNQAIPLVFHFTHTL